MIVGEGKQMRRPVVNGIIITAILMLLTNVGACSSSTPTNESKPAATSGTNSTPALPAEPVKEEIKPAPANIDATRDWQIYENAAHNLKIKYPPDWTKKEENGLIVRFSSSGNVNVSLVSEDLSGFPSMKLDEYFTLSMTHIEKEFKDFRLIENTPVTLGNVKARKIVYTAGVEGLNLKFMQMLILINQKAYVLTYNAMANDYDKNLETANNIFGSLSI